MRATHLALVLAAACTLSATAVALAQAATPDVFAACRERLAKSPDDYDSAYCFYDVAQQQKRLDDGSRVFQALMAEHALNFWLPLSYGHMFRTSDPDRAVALYRRSADGFRTQGHVEGEILARSNLRNFLFPLGRVDEANREAERVVEVGASAADPILKARVWALQAQHVQDSGGDLGFAFRLLQQAQAAVFPAGPYRLQRTCLASLAQVASRLGREDEALVMYRQLDDLASTQHDAQTQAIAQYNILNTSAAKEYALPSPGARQRLRDLAERALATGTAAQYPPAILRSHRTIAELLANDPGARAQAFEHVEQCLTLARAIQQPYDEAVCSWVQAMLLRVVSPERSLDAARSALDATERANNPRTQAYSAGKQMRWSWATKPRPDAIRDALTGIDAIETLRALQDEPESSAGLFSAWTMDYYWLSGRLLSAPAEGDVDLAFSITERMRARTLLDVVSRSRPPPREDDPLLAERRTILRELSSVQSRLLDPRLEERRRRQALGALAGLEARDHEVQRRMAVASPETRRVTSSFATLSAVQGALAADEALLSFQTGIRETYEGEFGGGSWLVVVTRERRATYAIEDRTAIATLVPLFDGLIERRDGLDADAAVRLYGLLLRNALSDLPTGVRRLVVVPDGALHHLPFEALRERRDAEPLGSRFELVVVPSATLWVHWRTRLPGDPGRSALVLADPELAARTGGPVSERNVMLEGGLRLGSLPHARREGRSVERHVGAAEVLVGPDASERALKTRVLRDYAVLHFAAHAVADEARPERSAVLLSPGAGVEDGLLQAREIETLDLRGRVVVLSACQTASGAVLRGEGVLSLARSFLEAGAHAVVGSRWPIRDADAAAFFDSFYRHLGEGRTLSAALTQARRDAIADGRPAAAWAAMVLIGDGALRPFPSERTSGVRPSRLAWFTLAPLVFVVTILVVVRRRRHARA